MTIKRKTGPARKFSHEAVVAYAIAHPTMFQAQIAAHFKTTQGRVSLILTSAGLHRRLIGKSPKLKPNQTEVEYEWEKALHDAGLGMDRGLRLGRKRILYGYDAKKESPDDDSATCNSNS
jgi:hypothetical protein